MLSSVLLGFPLPRIFWEATPFGWLPREFVELLHSQIPDPFCDYLGKKAFGLDNYYGPAELKNVKLLGLSHENTWEGPAFVDRATN